MAGTSNVVIATLFATTLALGSCSATDDTSLEDYVSKECAFLVEFKDRMARLTKDFVTNARDQTALAGTVEDIAVLYDGTTAKADELGDPPNGEGVTDSDELEQATKTLARTLHTVASDIRTAESDVEVQAATARMNDAILKSTTIASEWQKAHPTPEIDRLKRNIPGCSDEPQ